MKKMIVVGGKDYNVSKHLRNTFEIVLHVEQDGKAPPSLPPADFILVIANWIDHGRLNHVRSIAPKNCPIVYTRRGGWSEAVNRLEELKLITEDDVRKAVSRPNVDYDQDDPPLPLVPAVMIQCPKCLGSAPTVMSCARCSSTGAVQAHALSFEEFDRITAPKPSLDDTLLIAMDYLERHTKLKQQVMDLDGRIAQEDNRYAALMKDLKQQRGAAAAELNKLKAVADALASLHSAVLNAGTIPK